MSISRPYDVQHNADYVVVLFVIKTLAVQGLRKITEELKWNIQFGPRLKN